jgi:hypothetical protein
MDRIIKLLFIFMFSFLVFSCNSDENHSTADESIDVVSEEKFDFVAPSDKNFPFKVAVLSKSIDHAEPLVIFNEATGKLEVSSGKKVSYQVTELELNLEERKKQLESGIFKISYTANQPDQIVYRSELPDGSTACYHFIVIKKLDNRTFVFEDNPLLQFNQSEISLMVEGILKTI